MFSLFKKEKEVFPMKEYEKFVGKISAVVENTVTLLSIAQNLKKQIDGRVDLSAKARAKALMVKTSEHIGALAVIYSRYATSPVEAIHVNEMFPIELTIEIAGACGKILSDAAIYGSDVALMPSVQKQISKLLGFNNALLQVLASAQ